MLVLEYLIEHSYALLICGASLALIGLAVFGRRAATDRGFSGIGFGLCVLGLFLSAFAMTVARMVPAEIQLRGEIWEDDTPFPGPPCEEDWSCRHA